MTILDLQTLEDEVVEEVEGEVVVSAFCSPLCIPETF